MTLFWLFWDDIFGHPVYQRVDTYELECARCGARRPGDEWWYR
jgi:hypothetical protein